MKVCACTCAIFPQPMIAARSVFILVLFCFTA
jgi:hypothetical protein